MTSFIYELKRRNVIRVSATYLVVSWLLLQVGDVIFSALKLDDSAQTLLLAMLALGFIPAVIFSWIYELTPDGIKRDSEVGANEAANTLTSKRLNYITITAILILIPMLIWSKSDNAASTKSTEIAVKSESGKASEFGGTSIAVLPFQEISSAGDQEYFGDGIAEELLNSLGSTEGLRVAARTSSFKFKNANVDIPEIGLALNVKTVLEGSIRKVGDQVRITAQLINVDDGYHLWSQTYDRKLDNIFAVQDEIALAIVDALKLKLNLKKEIRQDIDPQAYDFYLRGRNSARTINKKSQLTAVDFFEKAIAIDPQFADAYAGYRIILDLARGLWWFCI
jgi:TolB-like protein